MNESLNAATSPSLSLPEEFLLMLLNEETGYFHHVEGWELHCVVVGAALAELSLIARIDMDEQTLFVVDTKATGNDVLDMILTQISESSFQRNVAYWIERFSIDSHLVIDMTLEELVAKEVLSYHNGDFWSISSSTRWRNYLDGLKNRIAECIHFDQIPNSREAIVIALMNVCDVMHNLYELDEDSKQRVNLLSKLDVVGRSIAAVVKQEIESPLLRRSPFKKKIPVAPMSKFLLHRNFWDGNIPALFASMAQRYGPVFQIRPPFAKPLIFLAGKDVNHWVHRRGRIYLRSGQYFSEMEKIYGASGLIPSLDGADHFKMRKLMTTYYNPKRLALQLNHAFKLFRSHVAESWQAGNTIKVSDHCRILASAQICPITIGLDIPELSKNIMDFKERALIIHLGKLLPRFMMRTPKMKCNLKSVGEVVRRVHGTHTPAQRANKLPDLADDVLNVHASDPQFLPEANLAFYFSAPVLASLYLGDALSMTLYALVKRPDLYRRVTAEADTLFVDGDPAPADLDDSATDVTDRFIMESMRMNPVVPMAIRNVANTCEIEGYELPLGERVHVVHTAAHYMEDAFPEPAKFDIDRYLPTREEHRSLAYAPYGLGTHKCAGYDWMKLALKVNLLMIVHYYTLEISPQNFKHKYNPIPSMSSSKKLKFLITEQRHELPVAN